MKNKSYEVLVIGSGPIGTACSNYLFENGISVLNIFTKSDLPVAFNPNTEFKPSKYTLITSGETGLAQVWGNAHDLPRDEKFEVINLKQIQALSKFNWPDITRFNESKFNKFIESITENNYTNWHYYVKKNVANISNKYEKIQANAIHWKYNNDSQCFTIEYKKEDDIKEIVNANTIILAAGTLGNATLLHSNSKSKKSKFEGYTNHPKYISHMFNIKYPIKLDKKDHDLMWTRKKVIELLNHADLRASARVWPVTGNLLDKIFLFFGYARKFQTMIYLRAPSLVENYMEVNDEEISIYFSLPNEYIEIYKKAIMKFGKHLQSLKMINHVKPSTELLEDILSKDANHHLSALKRIADENLECNRKNNSRDKYPYVVGVGTIDTDVNHPTWVATIESLKICDEIISTLSKRRK